MDIATRFKLPFADRPETHSFFVQTAGRFNRYGNQNRVSKDPYAPVRQPALNWRVQPA